MSIDTLLTRADDDWLTRKEVSEIIRFPVQTLANWGSAGQGPRYVLVHGHARYRVADVRAWQKSHT